MLDAVAKDDWRWCCRIHWPLTFDVTSYNSLFNEHLAQLPMHKADMYSMFDLWELLATVSQSLHYIIGNTTGSLVGNQLTKLIMMSTRHISSSQTWSQSQMWSGCVPWQPVDMFHLVRTWPSLCCLLLCRRSIASFFSVPILLPGAPEKFLALTSSSSCNNLFLSQL